MDSGAAARGRGRGRGRGRRGGRRGDDKPSWVPVTKLGRLVNEGKVRSLEEIYKFSLPIKEVEIIDRFLTLKEEVLRILTVQKQTRAGQRTRFKAIVLVGDERGHVGLGVKCASETANAIRGAVITAKLSVIPIRKGYWGSRFGEPHTVPCKVTGKCGSVAVRLVPAPRGTGLVAAGAPKKLLHFAGLQDVFMQTTGHSRTLGNFVKATFQAVLKTYSYLTPDLWAPMPIEASPIEKHAAHLMNKDSRRTAA